MWKYVKARQSVICDRSYGCNIADLIAGTYRLTIDPTPDVLDSLSDLEYLTSSEKSFAPTMRPLTFETKSSPINNLATTVIEQELPLPKIIHATDIHDGHPYVQDQLSKTHGDLENNSILDWASDGIENNISSESESTKSDSELAYILKKP